MQEIWEIEGGDLKHLADEISYGQDGRHGLYKLSVCIDDGPKFKVNEGGWTLPLGQLARYSQLAPTLTDEELTALRNLAAYSYAAEKADYERSDEYGQRHHIFNDLLVLEKFLTRVTK